MNEAKYQMQDDTIISWTEDPLPNSHGFLTEIALSFAEADGCREVWDKITQVHQLQSRADTITVPKDPLPNTNLASDFQHQAHNPNLVSSHPLLTSSLALPTSIASPHTSSALDPLVSSVDAQLITSATRDDVNSGLNRAHHSSILEAPADVTHSSRFFDENLESPSPWGPDAIDDVFFRDSTSVLFLGSPGALVPSTSASDPSAPAGFVIPSPDRSGIEELYRIMSDQGAIHIHSPRERVIAEVANGDYVSKLCLVFRECEKSVDIEGLSMLYHIVRCLFIVGTGSVLEVLVNEKNLMDIVGCLEYDQEHITELERAQAEGKRCDGETSSKSTPEPRKIVSTEHASTTSSDKIDVSREPSNAEMKGEGSEKDTENPSAEQQKGKKSGDETDQRASLHKDGDSKAMSQSREGADEKHTASMPVENNSSSHQSNENSSAEAKAVVESSDNNSDAETSSQVHKNSSEETTSSGNLPGDGCDRRLTVRVHRDFLEQKVSFKSVVPITDKNVVAKIHQNYRVAYIRDVILSRTFDENANSALSGVILCNNVDIIMYFISGSSALSELFDRLKSVVFQRQKADVDGATLRHSLALPNTATEQLTLTDGDRPKKRCRFGDEVCATSRSVPDPTAAECEREQTSDSEERLPTASAAMISSRSCGTGSSEGSHATTLNPSTSKDVSSGAQESDYGVPKDTATGGPNSSESDDDIQRRLCHMLGFVRELCGVAKGQQAALKNRFHALLTELGALEVAVSLLCDKDRMVRSLCCDILSSVITHDQTEVRSHILRSILHQEKNDTKRVGVPLRSTLVESPRSTDSPNLLDSKKPCSDPEIHTSADSAQVKRTEKATECEESSLFGESAVMTTTEANKESADKEKLPNATLSNLQAKETPSNGSESATLAESAHPKKEGVDLSRDIVRGLKRSRSHLDGSQDAHQNACTKTQAENAVDTAQAGPTDEKPLVGRDAGQAQDRSAKDKAARKPTSSRQADEKFPLLAAMVDVACHDKHGDVALTALDFLRILLDPNNMRSASDRDLFLDVFYNNFVSRLLAPIAECVVTEADRMEKGTLSGTDCNASHICDLLSFCVTHHGYRGKFFVLGWDAGGKIAKLIDHRKAHIRLCALRFIRACVGMSDDMLDRYIMREQLMGPVMKMLGTNQNKDNLISAAVLDVVTFIYHQGRVTLLKFVLDNYSSILEPTSSFCSAYSNAKKTLEILLKAQTGAQRRANTLQEPWMKDNSIDPLFKLQGGLATKAPDGSVELMSIADYLRGTATLESSSANLRLVSNLVEHDTKTPQDEDSTGKAFERYSRDVSGLGDLHSVVVRSGSRSRGPDDTRLAGKGEVEKQKDKRNWMKSVQECKTGEAADCCKSGDDKCERTEGEDGMVSASKKRKRKTSLVGYGLGDSDEEVENVRKNGGRSIGRKAECSSSGSGGSSSIKLSLSKSGVQSGEVKIEDDYTVKVSDTSEESGCGRKREGSGKAGSSRSGRGRMADGGIETCTRAVMEGKHGALEELDLGGEESDGSPRKRRRTEEVESEGCGDGAVEGSSCKPSSGEVERSDVCSDVKRDE